MLFRLFGLFTLIFAPLPILGCSTPESQERVDTVLCWLRPSCLPSQPRTPPPPAKATTSEPLPINPKTNQSQPRASPHPAQSSASKPLPTKPKTNQLKRVSSPKRPTTPCLTSAKTTVHGSKPYAKITYMEPTTNAKGQALTNLAKTTIYHDLGKGLVKYKDIPATKPQGGGTVQEKVSFSVSEGTSIQVTICVTATNTNGQEG